MACSSSASVLVFSEVQVCGNVAQKALALWKYWVFGYSPQQNKCGQVDWHLYNDTFKFILDPGQPAKHESVSPATTHNRYIQLLWTVRLKLMLPHD